MIRFFLHLWGNFKEYIVLVILILASLVTLSLNNKPGVKQVRAVAFVTVAAVTSVISDVINIASIKNENKRLQKINAELMLQVNRLREYGIQNAELKALLGVKDSLKYPLIPAAVISKSQSTFTLNAGNLQGVKPGMPVINDLGLVGVVNTTSDEYSIVRTLKNFDLKLTVKDQRSRIDGIMKWDGENLIIVNVPKTYDIEAGDRIITSSLSSIVSIPLPVGVVIGLSKEETGIFNEVKIKPFVDFIRSENVFVVAVVESVKKNNQELNFFNRK